MQTRDNDKKQTEEEKRDVELENIVGNPLIAEYQVDRLRTRVADLVSLHMYSTITNGINFRLEEMKLMSVLQATAQRM